MAIIEGTTAPKTWVGEWDFAIDGGAIATIALRGVGAASGPIPNGSVIESGYVEVLTLLTSGGAGTAALQVEAANDMITAAAVSGAPWSTTGNKSIVPVATGASAVKTTAARNPSIVFAAFAITAGKIRAVLNYR